MANNSHYLVALIFPVVLTSSCTTKYPVTKVHPDAGTVISRSMGSPTYSSTYRPYSASKSSKPSNPKSIPSRSSVSTAKKQPVVDSNRQVARSINPPQKRKVNTSRLNRMLFKASEQGSINTIWQLLEQGANVRSANTNGETSLHSAAAHNQIEAIRVLLDSGADVNAKTISGWTPLHSAARFGYSDAASVLLQSGANARLRNRAGRTALSLAQQAKHLNVVNVLQGR